MIKLKKRLTKHTTKEPVTKKQKLTYILDNINFKTCEEFERYKKLKEHSHFQEIIDEKTVKCMLQVYSSKTTNIELFWKLNKEEQRTIETPCINVACSGLTDEKYHNYILLSPLQHGGSWQVDTVAYKLFPEKFHNRKNYSWDVLEKDQRVMKCLNFTTNRSGICDNCFELMTNAWLNDAIKTFVKLLKNQNLKKLYCASANSDEAKIWLELAELGRKRAFTTNKTFKYFRSRDQDILTNLEISLENIACFAKVANEL
ncbi:943_t:CDS:2 [Funneliformis geosporum]|nr:943_t:CDS:2 [Funneliformis geosporum]